MEIYTYCFETLANKLRRAKMVLWVLREKHMKNICGNIILLSVSALDKILIENI